jgi:hypothetical protein
MTVMILLTIFLAPGLLHARTAPVHPRAQVAASASSDLGLFSSFHSVWNLLANYLKTGGQMDPNGGTPPPPPPSGAATSSDTGGQMDPNGTPQ